MWLVHAYARWKFLLKTSDSPRQPPKYRNEFLQFYVIIIAVDLTRVVNKIIAGAWIIPTSQFYLFTCYLANSSYKFYLLESKSKGINSKFSSFKTTWSLGVSLIRELIHRPLPRCISVDYLSMMSKWRSINPNIIRGILRCEENGTGYLSTWASRRKSVSEEKGVAT